MSRLKELLQHARESEDLREFASRASFAFFSWVWVLQTLNPWWSTWRENPSWSVRIVTSVLLAAFILAYTFVIYRLNFRRHSWIDIFSVRERRILQGTLVVIAVVLVFWHGDTWAVSMIFAALTIVLTEPPLQANRAAIVALVFVTAVLFAAQVELPILVSVLMLTFVFSMLVAWQMRQGGMIGELLEARYNERRMAATEERLRIARDLHDVLGHTLSLITLKSELASALAHKDPARAQHEMREVEAIARSAMTDVRRTVSAERQPILGSELADARPLLNAAGITLEVTGRHGDFPDEIEALFAWGVREGVTNVVRHSRAQHCRISLTHEENRAVLAVRDDGTGREEPGTRLGSGLTGLSDRAGLLGGTLSFETAPDGTGHCLTLTVPLAG